MKLDNLIGERFKERPSECAIDSHALMIRGGYMKYVANGIFSSYTPLKRITRKIEQIIREEMDAIDGQEVMFPVVLPASLWQKSGRYSSVGSELVRFLDRNKSPHLLAMTHEEAAVSLVREYGQSYAKYPFMVYQIQTKFRDEPRPRGGLIRVREFTMKDAYSFHVSYEDLNEYFKRCYTAYERIFARAGIPETVAISADSGMMGGKVSYEFVILTPVGEDSIAVCQNAGCGYRANVEAAESIVENSRDAVSQPLELVATPGMGTIEELCGFLNIRPEKSCKAVMYQKNSDDSYVLAFIRGDLDINETKLANHLKCDVHPAALGEDSGLFAGYTGPYGLDLADSGLTVLFDGSLKGENNMATGANKSGYHYTGLDISRDIGEVEYFDLAKITDGGICPQCKKASIKLSRGIEVGHIFQLGTKYTESMEMTYLDASGQPKYPVMGCYGIGVGRLAAAICEASHDEYGPIWPVSVAPWQVHICAVRSDEEQVKTAADKLYSELSARGIEVIYDDRNTSAGVMFSDADLLGVPLRAVISPRNLKEGCVEITGRDKKLSVKEPTESCAQVIADIIADMQKVTHT